MTKTDLQIQRDVLAELAREPSVDAARIGAGVSRGVVRLAGQVGSYVERGAAEHAAHRVGGVKALVVDIEVNLPCSSVRVDADLARSAQNVIEWMTYLPAGSVCVGVEAGWLTLEGEVDSAYQKQGAEACVASLIGVTGISNRIALRAAAPRVAMRPRAAHQLWSSSTCSEMS